MNKVNGGSALTTLTYAPDAADHLVDLNTMIAQFVSEILPPQTIAAQVVSVHCRTAEAIVTNNLFESWKLYAVNVAGTTVLGTLVAIFRSALSEMAVIASITGYCEGRTSTVFTANEPFRLVLEVGGDGLPTVSASVDGHNLSMVFGEAWAAGALNPVQNDDTTAGPAMLILEDGVTFLPLGEAVLALGI
jgi:fluoride ion exporter CrcB/FEX